MANMLSIIEAARALMPQDDERDEKIEDTTLILGAGCDNDGNLKRDTKLGKTLTLLFEPHGEGNYYSKFTLHYNIYLKAIPVAHNKDQILIHR